MTALPSTTASTAPSLVGQKRALPSDEPDENPAAPASAVPAPKRTGFLVLPAPKRTGGASKAAAAADKGDDAFSRAPAERERAKGRIDEFILRD